MSELVSPETGFDTSDIALLEAERLVLFKAALPELTGLYGRLDPDPEPEDDPLQVPDYGRSQARALKMLVAGFGTVAGKQSFDDTLNEVLPPEVVSVGGRIFTGSRLTGRLPWSGIIENAPLEMIGNFLDQTVADVLKYEKSRREAEAAADAAPQAVDPDLDLDPYFAGSLSGIEGDDGLDLDGWNDRTVLQDPFAASDGADLWDVVGGDYELPDDLTELTVPGEADHDAFDSDRVNDSNPADGQAPKVLGKWRHRLNRLCSRVSRESFQERADRKGFAWDRYRESVHGLKVKMGYDEYGETGEAYARRVG